MIRRKKNRTMDSLPTDIRSQFGTEINTRFLRALPAFRADEGIPEALGCLLSKLDKAEQEQSPTKQ